MQLRKSGAVSGRRKFQSWTPRNWGYWLDGEMAFLVGRVSEFGHNLGLENISIMDRYFELDISLPRWAVLCPVDI